MQCAVIGVNAACCQGFTATINGTVGTFPGQPSHRNHTLQIRGGSIPTSVKANGHTIPKSNRVPGWYVNTKHSLSEVLNAVVLQLGECKLREDVVVDVSF